MPFCKRQILQRIVMGSRDGARVTRSPAKGGAMKAIRWMALSMVVGLTCEGHAQTPIPTELDPSLKFLQTVTTPMPSFRGVKFYEAFPDSRGNLVRGMGHSSWVRGWFFQMEPMVPKYVSSDERLRLDVNVYADTVREEGEQVLRAAANLKQSLTALDRVTGSKLQDLLSQYNDEVKAVRVARRQFLMATKKAEEARFLVDATDVDAKECNMLLQRTKLEAEKSALLAKMQRGRAFLTAVEKAIGAMAGGPAGVAAYLTGEAKALTVDAAKTIIVDAFYGTARETLYEIGIKIEAIDKSLQDVKCKKQAAMLQAAKSNLEATMIQALLSFGEILEHRAKAWHAVDRLATLRDPQTGRTLPFFQNLQTYNSQVNLMGRKVFDSVNSHLDLLAREPLSRGELLLALVDEDIQIVEREKATRDPSGTWTGYANGVSAYWGQYAKWYRGEIKRGQTILEDLREGRHLDFVDRMLARATKELGGTVSYEDIIR
jgi:hypothetical protein